MKYQTCTGLLTALTIVMATGTSTSTFAQSPVIPAIGSTAATPGLDFRSSKWLNDRAVVNNNGEEIANVSDLILDRGAGRIEYLVIKTGATFGMGGRSVAVPYGSFKWEATGGKDRFILAATPEQLKGFPEYTPANWDGLSEDAKDEQNALRQKLAADAALVGDPYAGSLDAGKTVRVEGTISKVERVRTSNFGEHVVITVDGVDGATRRVALGPSWFVNATPAAPMRGDKVVIDALVLPRDPDQLVAGTELRAGDRHLVLRDTTGSPAWSLKTVETGGKTYSTPYLRYLLLSKLPGMKVDCRGNECGKVQDIIIDRNSGEIGFLSIDPNQNFLGIGDTKRLIPWSVATVMLDGTMRIDASKEMVLASPQTPADLSTINSGTHAERVYKAFGVSAPRFETKRAPFQP